MIININKKSISFYNIKFCTFERSKRNKKMELIKSTTITNSYTYEHLATIALYKSEMGYEIINKIGAKLQGVIRTTRMESENYYSDLIQETIQAFNSMEQPFHTK